MGKLKISSDDQKKLRENAKKELKRMETLLGDMETVELIDAFKNKYNVCETVYKVILTEHQKWKKKTVDSYLKVYMTQVPFALRFAGYSYDKVLLSKIFGSEKTSVKKLRDAVTHSLDEKAIEEIKIHKDELFGYMDTFLAGIRAYDAGET